MRLSPFLSALGQRAFVDALGVDAPPILKPTQDARHGDYQLNGALPLAKRLKRNPRELAGEVAERLTKHEAFATAEVAGPGFINLRLADTWLAAQLDDALLDRERDGVEPVERPETIYIDFSSPNIAKQMHVGHIRSTIIGAATAELLRFAGHRVVRDNHLGDWGTQFGLLICGMATWGDERALERDAVAELERVYKLASQKAKEDEAFAAAARQELAKLQGGDAENRARWAHFVAVSKKGLSRVYDRLGVEFDEWRGESAYHDQLPKVVERLLDAGIAREDQGAICVFFEELEGAPARLKKQGFPFIVQKSDGAYLYSTTDIATVLYRAEQGADRSVYVVDHRQGPHFEQLFEVAKRLGVSMSLAHVGFGMVLGPDGRALRTRDGKAITLESLLDEAEARAEAKMKDELGLDADLAKSLAGPVGIGAVKYADLSQNRMSNYQFDWEKMIAFEGNAGPYLQYAHARCCSIFSRGEVDAASLRGPVALSHDAERALGRRLIRFADVVHESAEQYSPHYVCEHLYDLARAYSRFFTHCPVLKAEPAVRQSRLALVDLTARQLRRGLSLLGIAAPPRM